MNCKGYIGLWVLVLYFPLVWGQQQPVLDTICIEGNPSHLAIDDDTTARYTWTVNGGTIISGHGTHDVFIDWGRNTGLYPVSVYKTGPHGCNSDTSRALVYLTGPEEALIDGPAKACRGSFVEFKGPGGNNLFRWNGKKAANSIGFVAKKDTTIYLVAHNAPCQNDTAVHRLKVEDPPIGSMNDLEDTLQIDTEKNLYFSGGNAKEIEWYFDGEKIGSGSFLRHQFNREGEYYIAQVSKSGNCADTVWQKVYVLENFRVHIPNTFTPNGDGVNDIFLFKGVGIESYTAEIYNRWGGMIYSWNEDTKGWDGTTPEGNLATQDVYIYKITVHDTKGGVHHFKNKVHLVR